MPFIESADRASLFVTEWVSPTRYDVLKRKLRFMTAQRLAVKIDNFVKEGRL